MPLSDTLANCLPRFINNEFVKGQEGKTFDVINPSDESVITQVHEATEKDVDIAVAAARKAFEGSWRQETPENRGKLLVNLANLFEKNIDLLAAVESLDNGKAISMAKVDISMCVGCLRYYGGWADKITGKVIDTTPDTFNYVKKEPIGGMYRLPECECSDGMKADNASSLRSDHSLELPPAHVGMEDWPGHCLR
jgi:acyl-CoA reductase-like NAD-dependent aldehyde dehydrogenase